MGWLLALEIAEPGTSDVPIVVMGFRGVPLNKVGKRGVSRVADAYGARAVELMIFGISPWSG